jgi:hypothetical protein
VKLRSARVCCQKNGGLRISPGRLMSLTTKALRTRRNAWHSTKSFGALRVLVVNPCSYRLNHPLPWFGQRAREEGSAKRRQFELRTSPFELP